MQSVREIIVVAAEPYTALARRLAHEISKRSECNGACWTIKQYEDNEFQLGGNRYVVLIGNPDENRITKDLLPVIITLQNKAGVCYGYDGAKAVIFGEGKLEQAKDCDSLLRTIGLDRVVGMWRYIWSYVSGDDPATTLRTRQTKAAIALFLAQCFDEWVGIRKPGQGGGKALLRAMP